jgi:AmiR/NasT family two-component response regulator
MSYRETEHLRVLIANEPKDRLALAAPIVAALGHEVIAREMDDEDIGPVTARERPDAALVGLGESSDRALGLIEPIVNEAACPVIALIHAPHPDFVREASKRGIFAYITDSESKDWQSSIDIVLRRFAEYHDFEGAFGRRAVTERAKGILMERHSVDDSAAFEMLREHSRSANRKLFDVASAVVDGHPLAAEGASRTVVGHNRARRRALVRRRRADAPLLRPAVVGFYDLRLSASRPSRVRARSHLIARASRG